MTSNNQSFEQIVSTRVLRLKAMPLGIVIGSMAAVGVFIATNWLILKGGEVVGPHLLLLNQFFIGYRVTFWGGLIGAAYAFVYGFVGGCLVAKMYNGLTDLIEGKRHGCA